MYLTIYLSPLTQSVSEEGIATLKPATTSNIQIKVNDSKESLSKAPSYGTLNCYLPRTTNVEKVAWYNKQNETSKLALHSEAIAYDIVSKNHRTLCTVDGKETHYYEPSFTWDISTAKEGQYLLAFSDRD
jgi:hypothetical protein